MCFLLNCKTEAGEDPGGKREASNGRHGLMTNKYLNHCALFRPPCGPSLLHRPEIQIKEYILSQYYIVAMFNQTT